MQKNEEEIREEDKPKTMKSWMCSLCKDEDGMPVLFAEETSYREHKNRHLEGLPIARPRQKDAGEFISANIQGSEPITQPKPEKKEIKLKYVYGGSCPNCGGRIDTIIVDLDKRKSEVVAVAFCNSCKSQLGQREAARL